MDTMIMALGTVAMLSGILALGKREFLRREAVSYPLRTCAVLPRANVAAKPANKRKKK